MTTKDPLGDRMKMYEDPESDRRFMPLLPILARLDGINFSKFTKGMQSPYDLRFRAAMIATTKHLVETTGALTGYTQSDEITLVWYSETLRRQTWFDGRVLKMCTHMATLATLFFFKEIQRTMPEFAYRDPRFDARANNVPTVEEGANNFLWRESDATKNSVNMLAHQCFSAKALMYKSGNDKLDMMIAKGINWNSMPSAYKRGVYVQRRIISSPFTTEEINALPPMHSARTNPNLMVDRSFIGVVEFPPLSKVTNRVDVIFKGAQPTTASPDDLDKTLEEAGWYRPEEPYQDPSLLKSN